MNEVILALLRFAYWTSDRLQVGIASHLWPLIDGWTNRYALRLARQHRRSIDQIRTHTPRLHHRPRKPRNPRTW